MKAATDPLNTILKAIMSSKTADPGLIQSTNEIDLVDKSAIRTEILSYVNKLRVCVSDEWKSRYTKMWEEILDIEIIAKYIYNPGKQQGTNFNRSLIANIIHYLFRKKIYKDDYNASTMALTLEGDKDHSVRGALGKDPCEAITSRLKRYFD